MIAHIGLYPGVRGNVGRCGQIPLFNEDPQFTSIDQNSHSVHEIVYLNYDAIELNRDITCIL